VDLALHGDDAVGAPVQADAPFLSVFVLKPRWNSEPMVSGAIPSP
jgi:hypothetical protein